MKRYLVVVLQSLFIIHIAASAGLPSAQASKLHPSLRMLASAQEHFFHGAPVFSAYGAAPEEIGVIVYASDISALRHAGIRVQTAAGTMATVRIRTRELQRLCEVPGVEWIDPGSLNTVLSDVSVPETGALLVRGGMITSRPYTGKDVIVLIYDTGIDYRHGDFRDPADPARSRILSIWDQTLTPAGGEASPAGFTYGVEYTKAQIEAELKTPAPGFVRQKDVNGHGTHVAGIAAGNAGAAGKYMGMAPEADIVVVKGGNGSFSESSMIDGLQYAENVAAKYNKPVVVNWSIGGQGGPHDGTRAYEVAVNTFSEKPGRIVCIAAGNDGSSAIHRSGTLYPGEPDTIRVVVPFYSAATGKDDDAFMLDIWTLSGASVDAEAISPSGICYPRASETSGDCPNDADGTISLWNFNASKMNQHRNIQLYVHDKSAFVPKQGTWKLVLKNACNEIVHFDVWLSLRSIGGSAVALMGGDNSKTVSMPATSAGAITAGAYVTRWTWPSMKGQYQYTSADRTGNIASFSSIGPTADGRQKPDIAAPGQAIFAAMSGFSSQSSDSVFCAMEGKHYLLSGTSMATPHAAGACALLLDADPSLTAARAKTLLRDAADADPFTLSASPYIWGSGKLDIAEAAARVFSPSSLVARRIIAYDSGVANYLYTLTGGGRIGMRFTPPESGPLTRILINLTTSSNRAIVGTGQLVSEVYAGGSGVPGTPVGTACSVPLTSLSPGTLNTVALTGAPIRLEQGKEYVLVLRLSHDSDTLRLRSDNAVTNVHSLVMKENLWSAYANNFRIRAEVTSMQGMNTSVDAGALPLACVLGQNFPNPFNPSTSISYTTPQRGTVKLSVFDVIGRNVAVLVNGEEPAGAHRVFWNGRTGNGAPASAGVYFYRLEAAGMAIVKKMVLLK
ncbi:MAG: S8 family serine peptidase [Acidobacteriota bacterium]